MPIPTTYQPELAQVSFGTLGSIRLLDSMGDDFRVLDAARVSHGNSDSAERTYAGNLRLLKYLLKNHHTSPFEHVQFNFLVECPIFIARQWMRHRTWSFNEVSARYTEVDERYYSPTAFRSQAEKNKQASGANLDDAEEAIAQGVYVDAMDTAFIYYKTLLDQGVAREMARMVLPVATITSFYASVDLHNLLKFIELRDHEHAQEEIRVYAQAIRNLIHHVVPWTMSAWEEVRGS